MNLLSWSRIRMFRDCPQKYQLYAAGTPQEPVEGFRFGVALHEALEQYVGACQQAGVSEDYDLADRMAEAAEGSRLKRALRQFPVTITIRPDLVPVGLETAFELPIGDWLFRGRMDRIELDGPTVRIIDYKSGFRPQYPKDPEPQLLTYAGCWQQLHPEAQRFDLRQVWPEADPQLPSPTWQVEGKVSLDPVYQAIAALERETKFEARPSQKACQFCPYLTTACPRKPEVITTPEDAVLAYERGKRLLAQVKEYTQDNLVEDLPKWLAPAWVARGEGHYAPKGLPRSKEQASNRTEIIRKVFVHASAGEVKLSSALDVKTSWLNREMGKGTSLAEDLLPYVYQIPPKATWRAE